MNTIRINRLINSVSNRSVFVALDHGFTYGKLSGLENVPYLVKELSQIKPEAFIIHKGQISKIQHTALHGTGIIIQLTASSEICSNVVNKELVCQVEEALILGADGVAFQLNIGNHYDMQQVVRLSSVIRECGIYNMPILVMLYCAEQNEKTITHGIRLCEELGVDFIKVSTVSIMKSLDAIVKSSCSRILIAGGDKMENYNTFISTLSDMDIHGVVIGRNIFQHEKPYDALKYTTDCIHRLY